MVCDIWLARDFLARTRRPIDIPPCGCSADLCPPIKTEENEMTQPTEYPGDELSDDLPTYVVHPLPTAAVEPTTGGTA